MKNKIHCLAGSIILFCAGIATAQTPSNRMVATIIADVLAQLPAERQTSYDQLMKELADTGAEGVKMLVGMMNVPEQGEREAVEYALSGLTHYVSNDRALKDKTEQAYIAAMDEADKKKKKTFIMCQLALVGSEAGVNKLAAYLIDDNLTDPAANAIASIGGEPAAKSLQMALIRRIARSPEAERSIIQALGDVRPSIDGTEGLLKTMINTNDLVTKGIVLKALSRTGTKQSLADLAAVAASTGYKAEITDANGAYVRLIKRVYEQGDKKEAAAAAQGLLKNTTKSGSTQIRIAALEIIFTTQTDVLKMLRAALKDNDKAYRSAALNFASGYTNKGLYTELYKYLPKANTDEKIDLLYWIGNEANDPEKKEILKTIETSIERTGTQTLILLLNDSDSEVRQAVAGALGAIGDRIALPALVDLLKSQDNQMVSCAKTVLASFPGDISQSLARIISQASDEGKKAAMELLSARKANTYFNAVLEQTKSMNPDVRNTAYNALQHVVSERDFVILCGTLETTESSYYIPLQQAIIASIASLSPEEQTKAVTNRMLQAGDAKKYIYYPVLASTNDPAVLDIIVRSFNEEGGKAKETAFEALRSWQSFSAEEALYDISQTSSAPYDEKAAEAYITLILREAMTGENSLLFLRKAMEVAKTDGQRNRIIENIGKIRKHLDEMPDEAGTWK